MAFVKKSREFVKSGPAFGGAALISHRMEFSPMCHVLIIEDEPFIAMDLQQLLEEQGATSFDFADSEDEAVAAAMQRRPDIITSDVKLTKGTGPAAVLTIHEQLGQIPVIF